MLGAITAHRQSSLPLRVRVAHVLPSLSVHLAFNERQAPQPDTDSEQELADHDLAYLLLYLAQSRGESYKLLERPDELLRNAPAPDIC